MYLQQKRTPKNVFPSNAFFCFFPLVYMREQVMLLKAEFMYGEASEVLVTEHTILGPRRGKRKVSLCVTFLAVPARP